MHNVALLGCGRIAENHARILGEGQVPGVRLAAVCDVVPGKAEVYAKRYGVPMFTDYREMLARPDIDVVVVLTPSGMHPEHSIAAARAGKHVVCEKPMALRLRDADRMIEEADKAGVRLFVVKQNRYNAPVQALRRALEAGRFGRLILGTARLRWMRDQSYYDADAWRGTWKYDGGALTNQAVHHLDMLRWMMGDVVSVKAYATTALAKIEAEDTLVAVIRFASGALGAMEATSACRPCDLEASLSVMGATGEVVIGGTSVNKIVDWHFCEPRPGDDMVAAETYSEPANVYGTGHLYYYQNVVDCLDRGLPALVDGREARKTVELLCAIYESVASGNEITLPFTPEKCPLGRGLPEV